MLALPWLVQTPIEVSLAAVGSRDMWLYHLGALQCRATNIRHAYCSLMLAMAVFKDLAAEIQEIIRKLVLPASRGVHWVEVDGIPHEPEFIRDSIRLTGWYKFDRMPEAHSDIYHVRVANPGFDIRVRANKTEEESSPFFRHLLTNVSAVFEQSEPDEDFEKLQSDLADEIAYTSRCRQLSTYSQFAALVTVCRLSRSIARQYIQNNSIAAGPFIAAWVWPIVHAQWKSGRRSTATTIRRPQEAIHPGKYFSPRFMRLTLSSSGFTISMVEQHHCSSMHHGNTGSSNLHIIQPLHALIA